MTEHVRRGQRHGTLRRSTFRRCTRRGVANPITRKKIVYEGCLDRWEKDKTFRNQTFINGHSKEELQSWDARMRRELGDHAECQPSRQAGEQIHSGGLKMKQSANVSHACEAAHRASSGTWARTEDSREVTACRESDKHTRLLRRLNGMVGGRFRGGMSRGGGLKDSTHDGYFSQVKWLRWSTISGHPSGRWKHTDHRCHIFCNSTITFVSQDFGIYIFSLSSHVIADILDFFLCSVIALRVATAVLGKGKLLCVQTTSPTLRTSNTPCFLVVTKDWQFSQVMSPSTRTNSMNRRDLLVRSGQATPSPQGGNVWRRTMSNSLPALPSVPSDQFMTQWKWRVRRRCNWHLPAGGNPTDQEDMKTQFGEWNLRG